VSVTGYPDFHGKDFLTVASKTISTENPATPVRQAGLLVTLTALGVVYGDIGTSPLYALRECFHSSSAIAPTVANILGILSLIFWSLILVISIKYLTIVMRASNHGEGGILILMTLAVGAKIGKHGKWLLMLFGLLGAGLLFGDGMITPAISVLSAVEGLHLITPAFDPYVLPITIAILFGLFAIQHRGTADIGTVFGPVMLLWFATIATLGIAAILKQPQVLGAVSPHHAASFLLNNQWAGCITLGLVFLVVTGGEALYADLGHFGVRPIRYAWYFFVLPALLLNYFGQGALLIGDSSTKVSPFYHLAPEWAQYPLVILATAATIIASQAVITGAFSLGQQMVRLGYSPRLNILHTSSEERGQIYIPFVNWTLFVAVIGLVLSFKSSSNLAAAYGMAVTSTMVITTVLLYVVARKRWGWSRFTAAGLMSLLLIVDLAFFSANLTKLLAGGWFPILIGVLAGLLMATWRRGRQILRQQFRTKMASHDSLLQMIEEDPPVRVPGYAVYLTAHPEGIPLSLLQNMKHNKVLHKTVGILTILTEHVPYIPFSERIHIDAIGEGLYRITARYGFMQRPNVPRLLQQCDKHGISFPAQETTYFLGRETVEIGRKRTMSRWRKHLFVWMSRNAHDASVHFGVPLNHVIEIGVQLEI
jgi:KUP system potassium uptake protein